MFDPHNDLHRVGSLDELRTHYRHPHAGTRGKERPALDAASATVAERCRFATIGTFDVLGNADVSPRGGPSGFIRLDTLENIVATGRVALLLITPGKSETVRVNGAAFVSTDPELLHGFQLPKPPKSAIVIRVETTYMHCAKAFMRSGMWDQSVWAELADVPDGAAVLSCQGVVDVDAETTRKWLDDDYAEALAVEAQTT